MARRIIIKGPDIPKDSGSGVKIGDRTLEEFIAEEESREIGEVLTPERKPVYHKGYDKHLAYKESSGHTRIYTRREINAENWEKIMENQKTIEGVIAALLLSGREVTGRELQNNCVRQLSITKKKYSTRSTYLFHKTDFGKFITSRRDGKGAVYKLVPAALDCKPEELLFFIYKGNDEARNKVLEHHKGLAAYLEPKEKKKEEVTTKDLTPTTRDTGKFIRNVVSEAIAQELGVNVKVSGRVEIVFKLG